MHTDRESPLQVVDCPECGAPAEIIDRFTLQSTDGAVPHTKTRCARQHWFLLPIEPAHEEEEPASRRLARRGT